MFTPPLFGCGWSSLASLPPCFSGPALRKGLVLGVGLGYSGYSSEWVPPPPPTFHFCLVLYLGGFGPSWGDSLLLSFWLGGHFRDR